MRATPRPARTRALTCALRLEAALQALLRRLREQERRRRGAHKNKARGGDGGTTAAPPAARWVSARGGAPRARAQKASLVTTAPSDAALAGPGSTCSLGGGAVRCPRTGLPCSRHSQQQTGFIGAVSLHAEVSRGRAGGGASKSPRCTLREFRPRAGCARRHAPQGDAAAHRARGRSPCSRARAEADT
jgi:hypothetical protein